jgi:transcriptional regulator with XRE-family HTH domain
MPGKRQIPDRLGEKLRIVRERLGYSFAEMAAKLSDEDASVPRHYIHRYENNQSDPTYVILLRYSRLSKVKMEIFADDKLDLPK